MNTNTKQGKLRYDLSTVSPQFIEQKLFDRDLNNFLAILGSYRGAGDATLESILGDQIDDVLQNGLRVLRQREIRLLLDNPSSLLSLQEAVFCDGGDYWQPYLNGSQTSASEPVTLASKPEIATRPTFLRRYWLETVAAVAMGIIGVSAAPRLFDSPVANRDALVAFAAADRLDRLEPTSWASHLATGMVDLKIRENELDEDQFGSRLASCVDACSKIYQNDLEFVDKPARDILRDKCRRWMQKFTDLAVSDDNLNTRAGTLNGVLSDIATAIRELEGDQNA